MNLDVPGGRPEDRPGYDHAVAELTKGLRPTQHRIRRVVAALEELRLAAQQDPRPGSPRERDLAAAGSFSVDGFRGVWEDRPLDDAHNGVMLALYAIGQEMEGIARGLDALPLAYADVVLTRSVMETAARAWWMVEPSLAPRDRAARHITELLYGLHQFVEMVQASPPPSHAPNQVALDTPQDWLQREADMKVAAGLAGFLVRNGGSQGSFIDGQRRIGSTKLMERFFDVVGMGRVAYYDASAIVHGSPSGLVSRYVGLIGDRTRNFAMIGPDPSRILLSAGLAILATLEVAERVIAYDGLEATKAGLTWSGISQGVVADQLKDLEATWPSGSP